MGLVKHVGRAFARLAIIYERSIDQETYTTQRDRLRGDMADVNAELELLFDGADDFQMLLNFTGWVLKDVATNWIDADVRGRRALQAVVFPSGLLFDGQEFGNIDPCFAFKHLAGDSDKRSKVASPTGCARVGAPETVIERAIAP